MLLVWWKLAEKGYALLITAATKLQPFVLLVMRLYWGYQFLLTGSGKLSHYADTVKNFTEWGVPMPALNVYLASGTECVCGCLLLLGLASRLAALPLIGTMSVAYLTAHIDVLKNIRADADAFVSAPPFLFLLTSVIVFVFGPGLFSVDGLIAHLFYSGGPAAKE